MCKLSAVIPRTAARNNLKAVPMLLTTIMLENGRLSNKDGFGMGIIETGEIYRKMVAVETGLPTAEAIQWLWKNYTRPDQIMMGHCRLSTTAKGHNEDRNAHPFFVNGWMLGHNGHIVNYEALRKEMTLPDEVEVDSEVALYALAEVWKDAPTLTIELVRQGLDRLEGGYAFIIGHQSEPEKLYLVVGSNPLHIYSNDRFTVVNTDTQLLSFVNRAAWSVGIGYGHWQEFAAQPLLSNHVYTVDKGGVTELGTFVPKSAVRVWTGYGATSQAVVNQTGRTSSANSGSTSGGNTGSAGSSGNEIDAANLVDPAQAAKQVSRLENFMDSFGLTVEELEEMLQELPWSVPDVVWMLDGYDIAVQTEWFAYLSKLPRYAFDADQMNLRRRLWNEFRGQVGKTYPTHSSYQIARRLNPEFVRPYYLNEPGTLTNLKSLLALEDGEVIE